MLKAFFINFSLLILLSFSICIPALTFADNIQYLPLAPIQNVGDNPEGTTVTIGDDGSSFGKYLNDVYKFGIALCGALAVLMIVIGGVQYVSSDAWSGKEVGKERITAAMLGLVVALGSYVLLRIVSPKLLDTTLSVQPVVVAPIPINPATGQQYGAINPATGQPYAAGINPATGLPYVSGPLTGNSFGMNGENAPGGTGASSQAIITNAANGMVFPNAGWNEFALQEIQNSGLSSLSPSDAARFFPGGQATPENWLHLISSMSIPESGFNPRNYTPDDVGGNASIGLMQMSAPDAEARKYGYNEEALKDPYNNLKAAIGTMRNLVKEDGCIGCGANGNWKGLQKYWSPMRK